MWPSFSAQPYSNLQVLSLLSLYQLCTKKPSSVIHLGPPKMGKACKVIFVVAAQRVVRCGQLWRRRKLEYIIEEHI